MCTSRWIGTCAYYVYAHVAVRLCAHVFMHMHAYAGALDAPWAVIGAGLRACACIGQDVATKETHHCPNVATRLGWSLDITGKQRQLLDKSAMDAADADETGPRARCIRHRWGV